MRPQDVRMAEESVFDAAIIEDLSRDKAKLEETIFSLNDENAEMIAEVKEQTRLLHKWEQEAVLRENLVGIVQELKEIADGYKNPRLRDPHYS